MKNNRISYYYINNNMTNNTKRTKKPCKRNRTTLKISLKKRGGEGSLKKVLYPVFAVGLFISMALYLTSLF